MKKPIATATYDPRQAIYTITKGAGMVINYPIFRSPKGKMYMCIGYAVQTEDIDDPSKMNLTEWYLFEERLNGREIEYLCLEQGVASESLRLIKRAEIESHHGVTITEIVETLNALLPPVGWDKIR